MGLAGCTASRQIARETLVGEAPTSPAHDAPRILGRLPPELLASRDEKSPAGGAVFHVPFIFVA